MSCRTLRFEVAAASARIVLDRPDAANAPDLTMAEALFDAALGCAGDDRIRSVLSTGEGRMVCAGGDLKRCAAGRSRGRSPGLRWYHPDAGTDRLPCACDLERGLSAPAGRGSPDEEVPPTLMTARAAASMKGMLDRGFTTLRDTGGADWGVEQAVEQGLPVGPRLFIAGKTIGPTGGHSDARRRTDPGQGCHCCNALAFMTALEETHRSTSPRRRQNQLRQDACGRLENSGSRGYHSSPSDSCV